MALRERADTERGQVYVQVLASVLDLLVSSNDGQESPPVTRFHALRAPNISVKDYLERYVHGSRMFACSVADIPELRLFCEETKRRLCFDITRSLLLKWCLTAT